MAKQLFQQAHGMSRTRTYNIWCRMKQRCMNPQDVSFSRYGARGIAVCERWLKFEHFLKDMGEAAAKMTLDRINCEGNYEPENCRWLSLAEQQRNRTNNRHVTAFGRTQLLCEWAEQTGISASLLCVRLRSMTPEDAISRGVTNRRG